MSFSRAPPSDAAAAPTHRDSDVAQMARQALFPKKINRDGTHSTIFPAVQALTRLREGAMTANPNLAISSIFPKGVVVVKEIGLGTLASNGQPDIDEKNASFQVIPDMLSVKCMECDNVIPKHVQAYLSSGNEKEHKIILCSNRLVKSDYKPSTTESSSFLDIPPRSYVAVEEALAHQVTLVANQMEYNDNSSARFKVSCTEMAASELKAARAAECFYEKSETEVRRGSRLPLGYSLLPTFLQTNLMNRCIRSVATRAVAEQFGTEEGKQCVDQVMKNEAGTSTK
jgi:hypothetical protein